MRQGLRALVAVLTSPSLVLFLCLFAAQASLLVLSPILPDVAADFGVSTATAGQLRAVSGSVAAGLALAMGRLVRHRGLRDLLAAGLGLLAVGAAVSAAAPTFAVLAGAQVAIGAGLAFVLSSAIAAASAWAPERRAGVLSWTLAGQPAAWIVGMPVAGFVAEHSWRYAWLALPLAASALALGSVCMRARDPVPPGPAAVRPSVWRRPGVTAWAVGELCAYAGWAGTLVFAGALFIESYGVSSTVVGLLLAGAAIAYLPGTFLGRRCVDRSARPVLIAAALTSSAGIAAFGVVRPGVAWSAGLLATLAFVAGARTITGSALGLDTAPQDRLRVMSIRTAALQGGYLLGAALGGGALAAFGYAGLGVVLSTLFALAALPYIVTALRSRRSDRLRPLPGSMDDSALDARTSSGRVSG